MGLSFGIIITVAVLAGLFLLLREVSCWYWKTNKIINLLEIMSGKFDALDRSVRLLAERQALSMMPPAEKIPPPGNMPPPVKPPDLPVAPESYEKWETAALLASLNDAGYDAAAGERMREVLLARYGIRIEEGKFHFRDYVCDDLAGAVECAKLYNQRSRI